MTPTKKWTKVTSRLGLDRNPLRRRSDVIEAWLWPAVATLLLGLGPVAAGFAGHWVHVQAGAAQRAERSWHRASAVLLAPAPGPVVRDSSDSWLDWTRARWIAAGKPHVGEVPVTSGTDAGARVPIWLDRAGQVRVPPLTAGQVADRAELAEWLAVTALAVALVGAAIALRLLLDRRRLASWDTAWRSCGPQWTRHG
jgi:hypothetical protein